MTSVVLHKIQSTSKRPSWDWPCEFCSTFCTSEKVKYLVKGEDALRVILKNLNWFCLIIFISGKELVAKTCLGSNNLKAGCVRLTCSSKWLLVHLYNTSLVWKNAQLNLYTLTSIWISFILFSVHILRWLQGELVSSSWASFAGVHFPYLCVIQEWYCKERFYTNQVKKNVMKRKQTSKLYYHYINCFTEFVLHESNSFIGFFLAGHLRKKFSTRQCL